MENQGGSTSSVLNLREVVNDVGNSDCDIDPQPQVSNKFDIGLYVNVNLKAKVNDDVELLNILNNIWRPSNATKFEPQIIGTKKRYFQMNWLERFNWLAYSDVLKGVFCKSCVFFHHNIDVGKGKHQKPGNFVALAFKNWKYAIEQFSNHASNQYHKRASILAENFSRTTSGKILNVERMIVNRNQEEMKRNRAILTSIIDSIIVCGRQEMALRGHRDSGRLTLEEPTANDGNLRALLRYRIRGGDSVLLDHITTAGANATYLSPDIQNQILNIIGSYIQKTIIEKIRKAKFFTVLADETTDISRVEQFSMCVRYLDSENNIREDFLIFVPVHDVSGPGLASSLKDTLINLGLELNNMRGQGYDGAAAMRGKFRGCQAVIKKEYPKAIYTHCASHCLNLCLNDASKVSVIRNTFNKVGEICSFFRVSAQRSEKLKKRLQEGPKQVTTLIKYCETRWVERHDAILLFADSLKYIVLALEDLKSQDDKAESLHHCVCNFQFIIALKISEKLLGITKPLSEYLQKQSIDLCSALDAIEKTSILIQNIRSNSETEFLKIFNESERIAHTFGVEPAIPRIVGIQRHRTNISCNTPEEYFRRSIFLPHLDDFICSLNERFTEHKTVLSSLQQVVPKYAKSSPFASIKPALEFYKEDLNSNNFAVLEGEWEMWRVKWQNETDEPGSALGTLHLCNPDFFPNIHVLLQVLSVLPVTTATAERSFSTLKRLKTYLRNHSTDERTTSLALMSIHRNIQIDPNEIIDIFRQTNRRIAL